MAHFSKRNRRREKETQQALDNRLELVKEGFTRRDLIKMGLMTTAGVLIPKGGLTHAQVASSSYSRGCYSGCGVDAVRSRRRFLSTRFPFLRSCRSVH